MALTGGGQVRVAAAFSQSRVFRAVPSLHLAFLRSHATSVLDEGKDVWNNGQTEYP